MVKLRSFAAQSSMSETRTGVPTTSAPWRSSAAIASTLLNFQPGYGLCTISNPCAIQSMQSRIAASSPVTGGVRAKCSWISGSIRGWSRPPTTRCASADLATHGTLAALNAPHVYVARDRIGRVLVERRIIVAQQPD